MSPVISTIRAITAAAVASYIWSFHFDQIFDFVYKVLSLPLRPTYIWVAIFFISASIGVIGGIPTLALARLRAAHELSFYVAACACWLLYIGAWLNGVEGIFSLIQTIGFWSFMAGALAVLSLAQRLHLTTHSRRDPVSGKPVTGRPEFRR